MARKDRLAEIQNVKSVLDEARYFSSSSFAIDRFAEEAEKVESEDRVLDIYPVRAVSCAEVECRRLVREIVEFSSVYAKRAVPLMANAKPDYELLLSVAVDEVTFSDIVAHSVSFSNLTDIFSVFELLLQVSLAEELPKVTNPFGYAIDPVKPPLISDYPKTCAAISDIYAVRHRVCHEALIPNVPELKGIGAKLHLFAGFLGALRGYVVRQLYPNLPLNQMEINQQAGQSCAEARKEMQQQLEALRERYKVGDVPNAINNSQMAWEEYVKAQKLLRHDPAGGGTIGPYLRFMEEELLVKERTKRLEWFATKREGVL